MTKKEDAAEELHSAHEMITDEEQSLAADTLVGDLRDAILDRLRNMQKPWPQCSESEQRDIADHAQSVAENLTKRAVQIMAAKGRMTIAADLVQYTQKKGIIEAKIKTKATSDTARSFFESEGMTVLLVAADASEFEGERNPPDIDEDQGDLEASIAAKTSKAKTKAA